MEMNDKWIVNPDYIIKNDLDRACVLSAHYDNKYDSSSNWIGYIHPCQAIILSLFDGEKSISEIAFQLVEHFKISEAKALEIIEPYLGNTEPIYADWQGGNILFPKNMLIKVDETIGAKPKNRRLNMDFDWEHIDLTHDRAHRAPHSILWMLTSKCVTNCAYCYADKKTPYTPLSTERAIEIIEQAYDLGVKNIDVIGGEVFLRKDWEKLIGRMVALDMSPSFLSIKVPVTEDIIEKLISSGYSNVIQLSLDSLDDNVLSRLIKSKKGYVDEIKSGVALLENAGFKVQIDTILTQETATKKNLKELAEFIKTIKNLFYWEIRVPGYTLYNSNTFNLVKSSRMQLEEMREYVAKSLKDVFNGKIIFNSDDLDEVFQSATPDAPYLSRGRCGYLTEKMFILPDGKVSACEQLYWHPHFVYGDLTKESIEQVWQSRKAKELFCPSKSAFREKSACSRCDFFDSCNKNSRRCVVKVMKAYGMDNWDYPDPRCIFAPEPYSNIQY